MIATEDFGAAFRRCVGVATGKVCLACIAVMAIGPALQAAEAPGELRVIVIDKDTRRPVEEAALVVAPREEGDRERRQTDEAGAVRLEGLAPGLYAVRVDRAGYVTVLQASVRVSPRRTTSLELELIPGDARLEEVVVVASAARADATGSVSATYFDRETLRSAVGSGSDVLKALDGAPGSCRSASSRTSWYAGADPVTT